MEHFLGEFVRFHRERAELTQEELALRAGVGLRFLRELESNKDTLRIDKLMQVLDFFGYSLQATRQPDPYRILTQLLNRKVKIRTRDHREYEGMIVQALRKENEIVAWQFVSLENVIQYTRDKDENLVLTLSHAELKSVEAA